jgi:alkaline phosphatase
MYYEIALDIIPSGFEFFAGGGFGNREMYYNKEKAPDIYPLIEQAGYFIAKGYPAFTAQAGKAKKVVLVHEDWEKEDGVPYAINRTEKDLTLSQMLKAGIEILSMDNKKGFFFMLEAGRIDGAGHGNDGATMIQEVIDLDEAVKIAYEFYQKHPKETLIVITADHETGGLTAGRGSLNTPVLQYQKMSKDKLAMQIRALFESKSRNVSWEDFQKLLTETMGFWDEIPIYWENEKILRDAYESTLANKLHSETRNYSAEFSLLAEKARQVINDISGLGWSTGSHSAGFVPVFAIGVGRELVKQKMHTSDIPKNIIKAANY